MDKDFGTYDIAYLMNQLMVGLGFGESNNGGYIAQGGDVGGIVARVIQNLYSDCKGTAHPTSPFNPVSKEISGVE